MIDPTKGPSASIQMGKTKLKALETNGHHSTRLMGVK